MRIDRRALLGSGAAAAVLAPGLAGAQEAADPAGRIPAGLAEPSEWIELWPGGAPGMPAVPPVERIIERSDDPRFVDRAMTGIARPRMAVFRPARPGGAAVLIMPGGGYRRVVLDKEGFELGRWLAARGVAAFVLFYRLPGDGWANRADVPLADAQRAIRLIRHRAAGHGVDPARVAALGFSAGGHVCASLATRFAARVHAPVDAADALPARPLLAAPIYPVISMTAPAAHPGSRTELLGADPDPARERRASPHLHIPADAPPTFLVHAEDDEVVPVENSLLLRAGLRAHDIPVETHLFTHAGHGFGLAKVAGRPAAAWPELFLRWAAGYGL